MDFIIQKIVEKVYNEYKDNTIEGYENFLNRERDSFTAYF